MKFSHTNKAIRKINFKKPLSGSSIYETSSLAGIENEREFFWHQNESIYRSQILPKLLNSKQLYRATKLTPVSSIPIKFSTVSWLAARLLHRYVILLVLLKKSSLSFKHQTFSRTGFETESELFGAKLVTFLKQKVSIKFLTSRTLLCH